MLSLFETVFFYLFLWDNVCSLLLLTNVFTNQIKSAIESTCFVHLVVYIYIYIYSLIRFIVINNCIFNLFVQITHYGFVAAVFIYI